MTNPLTDHYLTLQQQRRAVRAFTDQQASEETLKSVFTMAQMAPSNFNTQPWKVAVVEGDCCRRLAAKQVEAIQQGKISMDFPYDGSYQGVYQARQIDAAERLYNSLNIAREDEFGRQMASLKNFEFYGAPHAALLFLPEPFGIREAADLGMYAHSLMLSLTAHGLASCPQASLSFMADLVREELDIAPENKLMLGLSFGYEDSAAPVNSCTTERAPLEESVTFYR